MEHQNITFRCAWTFEKIDLSPLDILAPKGMNIYCLRTGIY